MGSSYRKRPKSSSSKDKRKKRRRDVSLSHSEDCHSSSDTDRNYLKKRTLSKKTKKISRHSRSFEDRNGHKRKSRSERHSRSIERKKPSKRRRKLSPSSDSNATCSVWNSSNGDEIVHKKSKRSSHRLQQKVKTRRRSRYHSCSSKGCSSCSQCSVSSHDKSPPHNNPRVHINEILEQHELPNDHEDVAEAADIIQSNDVYPSSRSSDSNEAVRKGMQEVGASTSISRDATKIETSVDIGDSSVYDVEALLRQKALENFAKFRFRRLDNEKFIASKNDVSVSSESIQTEAHKPSARVTGNLIEGIGVSLAVEGCRDSSTCQSLVVTEDAECAATLKSDEKVLELISLTKTIPDGTVEISSVVAQEVEAVGGTAPQESHSPMPKICNGTSHDTEVAGKSDSELERKTMRVVRGGKLLKVGYELYIPKKYPGLSRRRFQR